MTTSILRPSHLRNDSPNDLSSPNSGVTLSQIWLLVATRIWNLQFCAKNTLNTVSQPTISRWAKMHPAGHMRTPEPHAKAKRGWNLYIAGQAMATRLRCVQTKMTRWWFQNVSVNATNAFTVRVEFDQFCSLGVIFRTVRCQHYRTSTMMVHFCHVACSVDCFRVRLGLGRESGLGAFKCVMLCGYFEEKYLSWHNSLIQNGRRNNCLGKINNEISLYAYDGMNILVGATVQGGSCLGGNCPGRELS